MAYSGGILSRPIRWKNDVEPVFNIVAMTLSRLCTNFRINPWAKYKPVKWSGSTRTSTWWKAYNNRCGFNISVRGKCSTLIRNYDSEYTYETPNGGEYPYRLLDFDGYYHNAHTLCYVGMGGEQDEYGRYIYYITESAPYVNFQFYKTDYSLNVKDFHYGLFPRFDQMYCGVVIKQSSNYAVKINPNPLGVDMTASAEGSGKWNRSIQLSSGYVSFNDAGVEHKIYPVIVPVHTYNQTLSANDYGMTVASLPVQPFKVVSASLAGHVRGYFSSCGCTTTTGSYRVTFTYTVKNNASTAASVNGTATFYLLSTTDVDHTGTLSGYYNGWKILGQYSRSVNYTVQAGATVNKSENDLFAMSPLVIGNPTPNESEVQFCLEMPGNLGTAIQRVTVS